MRHFEYNEDGFYVKDYVIASYLEYCGFKYKNIEANNPRTVWFVFDITEELKKAVKKYVLGRRCVVDLKEYKLTEDRLRKTIYDIKDDARKGNLL